MSRILDALRRADEERHGRRPSQLSFAELSLGMAAPRPRPEFAKLPVPSMHYLRVASGSDESRVRAGERFRLLRYRLEKWRQSCSAATLLVASAIPGEGKTLVAANLAETLTQAGDSVLLVDGDLRRPGLQRALGVPALPGLAQVLQGQAEWREAVRSTEGPGFHYLGAGPDSESAVTQLQSPGLRQLLAETSEVFDWVVLDSPPLLAFADALYLAEACQGVVLVARQHFTPTAGLTQAQRMLQNFPLIGLVLNAVEGAAGGEDYYYAYYHSDEKPASKRQPAAPEAAA